METSSPPSFNNYSPTLYTACDNNNDSHMAISLPFIVQFKLPYFTSRQRVTDESKSAPFTLHKKPTSHQTRVERHRDFHLCRTYCGNWRPTIIFNCKESTMARNQNIRENNSLFPVTQPQINSIVIVIRSRFPSQKLQINRIALVNLSSSQFCILSSSNVDSTAIIPQRIFHIVSSN